MVRVEALNNLAEGNRFVLVILACAFYGSQFNTDKAKHAKVSLTSLTSLTSHNITTIHNRLAGITGPSCTS